MKNFVVVVDTQYDFMMPDGILYVKGAEETINPIFVYLASLNPETTSGVLFTFDMHKPVFNMWAEESSSEHIWLYGSHPTRKDADAFFNELKNVDVIDIIGV